MSLMSFSNATFTGVCRVFRFLSNSPKFFIALLEVTLRAKCDRENGLEFHSANSRRSRL